VSACTEETKGLMTMSKPSAKAVCHGVVLHRLLKLGMLFFDLKCDWDHYTGRGFGAGLIPKTKRDLLRCPERHDRR
jgi:hypothetical protein